MAKEKQQSDFIFRVRACCICLTTKFETILWWFLKEIFHATFLSAAVEPKMSLVTGKMAKNVCTCYSSCYAILCVTFNSYIT